MGGTTFPLVDFDGQNAPEPGGLTGGLFWVLLRRTYRDQYRRLGLVFVNNWLWTKGRHSFDFGGEFRRTYEDIIACMFCSGTFNFSQRTTSTPNANDPNFGIYGSSFASFLLGDVDSGERSLAKLYSAKQSVCDLCSRQYQG